MLRGIMNDCTVNMSNFEVDYYLNQLNTFLDETGKFGYAIARNYRNFQNSIYEYYQKRLEILNRYGTKKEDDYVIGPDDDNYKIVKDKIEEIGTIKHDIVICKISMNDLPDTLTARNIIDLDWMIED